MLALGILLMLGGAAALLFGFDIVVTDRGLAMVLGGVTALAGGVVALGLAFLLKAAERIRDAMAANAARLPPPRPPRHVVPIAAGGEPAPEPPPALSAAAATAVAMAAALPAAMAPEATAGPEPESARAQPPTVAAFEEALQKALLEEERAMAGEVTPDPAAVAPADAPPAAEAADETLFEPPAPHSAGPATETSAPPSVPAVIGNYSAGGRRYTMFADGSVETETPTGTERFASLEALRRHLEAGRAG
jgi:hypothetical protein